ncbi:MAG: hypothetical protein ABR973_01445 [Candidatus Acidiferrales bacterium]|jgi:hypothetical protein
MNILAANGKVRDLAGGSATVFVAVCAVILAILANLESFHNSAERAQAYRESRELFLDVAREFDHRWDVYVRPLADSAEACLNASELYREIVVRDRDLRAKFKELTKTGGRSDTSRRP